jgi:hypothetical protein
MTAQELDDLFALMQEIAQEGKLLKPSSARRLRETVLTIWPGQEALAIFFISITVQMAEQGHELAEAKETINRVLNSPTWEVIMGDKNVNKGQAGAVGRNAHVHDFNQIWNEQKDSVDLNAVADELAKLRQAVKAKASTAEQDEAIGALAQAEKAARKGDGPTVLSKLAACGQWVLGVAKDIGVELAAALIQKSLGL